MKVYLGHDARPSECEAFAVAERTASAFGCEVIPLYEERLRLAGLLTRPMDRRGGMYDFNSGAAQSTEFAISPPNQPLPADTETILAARAKQGELPAAVIANRLVVTGAVLAIDTQAHTLKVVSPQGGEVHTFAVVSPEGRRVMGELKPGDKITAYITEGLLISTEAG